MATCLVIEESPVIREIACRILRGLGFTAVSASSAAEGVDACRATAPAAVLLDWDLPAMGALDFLRSLDGQETRPRVILCATENDPQQFTLAKAAGAHVLLLKPYDRTALAEALAEGNVQGGATRATA